MEKKPKELGINKPVAHLTNDFALKARIGFTTARQLCLFLLLVSQTNPFEEEDDMTGIISLKDIATIIRKEGAKRSGSIHKEVLDFVKKMMQSNYVEFQTSIEWRGQKLPKYVAIFDALEPIEVPQGNTLYRYQFNKMMRPHLKGFLRDFVSLAIPKGIKSGHAVRFLIMAKAHHDRLKAFSKTTKLKITVDDLKNILGIEGKYPLFTQFKIRVIQPILKGVNESLILEIKDLEYIKQGKKITHLVFHLEDGELAKARKKKDQKKLTDFIPNEADIKKLSYSQKIAYDFLCEQNCKAGIVYRQIIQKMPSSEYLGWEDVFIEKAWNRFEQLTKHTNPNYKAGAFIKWWQSGEFRDTLFSEIMESVITEKKKKNDIELFNRDLAKTMTSEEFKEAIRKF